MNNKIVVVGSINVDLTTRVTRHPHPGETLMGQGGTLSAGGKGANQAVAAALLGGNVTMIGAVGKDANAAIALERAREAGLDLSGITAVDDVTGLAVITVSDDGENTIVVVPGANRALTSDHINAHSDIIGGAAIVLMQGEIPPEGFAAAAQLTAGRLVVNLAPVVEVDRDLLLKADPIIANEHEAALVLRMLGVKTESADPKELGRLLLQAGFASAVLTLGSAGALVATPSGLYNIPTPAVDAVDTTGAGDAFAGALVTRLADGDDRVTAARFAARVGATATLKPGAQASYPTLDLVLPEVN